MCCADISTYAVCCMLSSLSPGLVFHRVAVRVYSTTTIACIVGAPVEHPARCVHHPQELQGRAHCGEFLCVRLRIE